MPSIAEPISGAHAVRCKMALSVAYVDDVSLPFALHEEVDQYLAKRHHVHVAMRLSEEEEMQYMEDLGVGIHVREQECWDKTGAAATATTRAKNSAGFVWGSEGVWGRPLLSCPPLPGRRGCAAG